MVHTIALLSWLDLRVLRVLHRADYSKPYKVEQADIIPYMLSAHALLVGPFVITWLFDHEGRLMVNLHNDAKPAGRPRLGKCIRLSD